MNEKEIIFTDTMDVSDFYKPEPASMIIPNWYKQMESRFPLQKTADTMSTIKKCLPVFDSMTAGYIIKTYCDVFVSQKDGKPEFHPMDSRAIESHPRKQAYLHPKVNDFDFPKWISPWAIKTPPGYSTLYIPPMHNPNLYFTILEGIVDTDTCYAATNFPFVLNDLNFEGLIPAGTPIAQVIPFKRENWKSTYRVDASEAQTLKSFILMHFFDRYKRFMWHKKSYK
jgi:hypothetical protein